MSINITRSDLLAMGVKLPESPAVGLVYPTGPWKHALIVAIAAPVRSKSNYRRGQRYGQKWGQVLEFEGRLREALEWAKPDSWPIEGRGTPLKNRHGVIGTIYARALLDTSNLSKSVYDAGEGVLYFNDAQIRAESSFSDRQRIENLLVCGFALLEPGGTAVAANQPLNELNKQVLATVKFITTGEQLK